MDDDSRPVEIWSNVYNYMGILKRGWFKFKFDNLEPGMIVRLDYENDYIYRVTSYPFLSTKYSPYPNEAVGTIITSESLYYYENH